MASIQSLGIGSGLLTTELVDDLVAAERESVDLRLDAQQAEYEAEISAFGTLTSALETFKFATDSLKAKSSLQAITTTSSDSDALTATASSLAEAGRYAIKIDQIAQSHSVASKSFENITDIVGTGELTFRFGTTSYTGNNYDNFELDTSKTSKSLVIDSSNNTLSSLRSAINNANFGVQATIVNDGSGYRLLLSTDDPGATNSMEIQVSDDQGSGLKEFAFNSTYNGNVAVGAISEGGTTDLSAGYNFSATNANFTLNVGVTSGINVSVTADATTDLGGGGGTAEDSRIAVQTALDTALVNAGLNAGDVVASIDPDDGGLVLTTLATGGSQTLEITADDGTLGLNAGLGVQYGTDGSLTQTQVAQSAQIEVNGLTITRESNLVTEVINGVTLNLKDADPGKTINLELAADTNAIVEKVNSFVDAFNELKVLTDEMTRFDPEGNTRGVLLGDATLRTVNSRIRGIMNSVVGGISGASFRTLSEVGITTNQNNSFLLELDANKLNAAIDENPDAIVSLFATNTSASDPLIEIVNTGSGTQPGTYDVNITQMATQGTFTGATVAGLASNVLIDADNDSFVITVNGVKSNTISLTQQTYATGNDLAQELQLRINNDEKIDAGGDPVTVSYNASSQRLEFTSSEFGSASSIAFSSLDTNVEAQLGFGVSAGTATTGVNVEGTINGEAATGSGQFLRASEGALAAKPGYVSSSVLGSLNVPLTVTSLEVFSGDYDFKINVDGVISGTLSLAVGTYNTAPELAAALQTAINNDANLSLAGKSANVDFDANLSIYGVISASTGSTSSVNFTELSANMASQFGFALGGGTAGTNASGDVNEAAGLRLKVLGGTIGSRGTAQYIEGTAFQLSELFKDMLKSDGLVETKLDSLNGLLARIEESRDKLNDRMEKLENRLVGQFSSADQLISRLQNTEDFLTQQLSLLNAMFTNKN